MTRRECPICGFFDDLTELPQVLNIGEEPVCLACYFWALSIAGDL